MFGHETTVEARQQWRRSDKREADTSGGNPNPWGSGNSPSHFGEADII